jgi:two-component system sensor histidine kinase KdpD
VAAAPDDATITPTDIAAAVHTLQSGDVAGHGSGNLAPAEWLFHPIRSDSSVLAALGLARDDGSKPISEEQEPLLESLLDQTALALTRARDSEPPRRIAAAAH